MTTTTATSREEKIYVLYASQTGNSEQAAKDFCAQVPTKLSPQAIQQIMRSNNNNNNSNNKAEERITVTTVGPMQMDDFLELHAAPWTRITVLFTSSYGVGQAPLGGYRFRELCDAWMDNDNENDENVKTKPLQGLSYALCGLGDSKYTTYFQNPTRIDEALQRVGAQRIGTVGKANASGTGRDEQGLVIQRWMDDIWAPLAAAVAADDSNNNNNNTTTTSQQLARAQASTVALCRRINPDFMPEHTKPRYQIMVAVLFVLVAIVVAFYLQNNK
eukprot:scaffold1933_cov165-Amphora_coffeaeformis.AAC.10